MKKDVAASAAGAVAPKKPEFSLIDEDLLKSRIYTIRGVKVMHDSDFRFRLTSEEFEILRSKKSASSWGGVRYAPYAFTEQGIYMLMTVLKGEQATAQSKALIRLFKQMKDYIAVENAPDISAGMAALATQTSQNTRDIAHYSRNCCKMKK